MKNLLLLFGIGLIAIPTSANTLYKQLCDYNINWKKYTIVNSHQQMSVFKTDKALIKAHLKEVINILKKNNTNNLSGKVLATRYALIKQLEHYRLVGKFPINYKYKKRTPVFIDKHNTHCAVGYLIKQSGHERLAQAIANEFKFKWIKDIKSDRLLAWQKQSGFTLEELKLIQGAYEFYMPDAFIQPNKHEIPQKPACLTAYFDNSDKIWCYGEGKNDTLHGSWIQNYSETLPWIVGYFDKGKRSGKWKEYYPGTNLLCRTEHWRDDKLNGIRRRFNKAGEVIETILFKNGEAALKTNYDLKKGVKWIRKPMGDNTLKTEVFTLEGDFIAYGKEQVDNPNNLEWFQNIELTALNSFAITSRDAVRGYNPLTQQNQPTLYGRQYFSTPKLVNYKKIGIWTYYKQYNYTRPTNKIVNHSIIDDFSYYGGEIAKTIQLFDTVSLHTAYDSIVINYNEGRLVEFHGHKADKNVHLSIQYHSNISIFNNSNPDRVKSIGQLNNIDQRIGKWKHYNRLNQLYKIEQIIRPEIVAIEERKRNKLAKR